MADGSKLVVLRDPGDVVEESGISSLLLNFFSGSFVQKISTSVTSDGATVTLALENGDETNDLTMKFSDGLTTLDVTPALSLVLDAGTLASPTQNYVYIPVSTKILTKDNNDWPSGEHIKVAFAYVESPASVQAEGGPLIHQPWNDGSADTGENGHMLDLAERIRIGGGADWYSGVAGTGSDNYLTITPGSPDTVTVQTGAGVVYQLHRHAFAAVDTSAGDNVHVVNHDTTPNVGISDLADLSNDAAGGSLNNKFFNVVLWGVANKGGTHSPLMLNLPNGTYNTQSTAESDPDRFTVFDIPRPYFTLSSTGFLIARMLLRKQSSGGGTWTLVETEDLRGSKPGVLAGSGAGGSQVEFPDNTFRLFDETTANKLAFQLSPLSANRTVTALDTDGVDVLSAAALTLESIPFVDGSGRLTEDLNFVRDATTGNVGINQPNPGAKLEVGGQIKITGGTPGAAKVLTDVSGSGLATWETAAGGGGGGGWTDDGTVVRLTTSTDRVGIGTASPSAVTSLHVLKNQNAVTAMHLTNATAGNSAGAEYRATHGSVLSIFRSFAAAYNLTTRFGQTLGGKSEFLHTGGTGIVMGTLEADPITLGTNNALALHIDSSQNVGVGTSAPATLFEVEKSQATVTAAQVHNPLSNSAAYAEFRALNAGISTLARAFGGAFSGTRYGQSMAGKTEFLHSGGTGMLLGTFEADPLTIGTSNTLAVHVDSSQDVGVGTSSPSEKLEVSGNLHVTGNITYVGTISDVSDETLKTDIVPLALHIADIRDKFMTIVPIRFGYNPDPFAAAGVPAPKIRGERMWGYSAQNLESAGLEALVQSVTLGFELDPGDPQPGDDDYSAVGGRRTGAPIAYKCIEHGGVIAMHTVLVQWLVTHAEATRSDLLAAAANVRTLEARISALEAR